MEGRRRLVGRPGDPGLVAGVSKCPRDALQADRVAGLGAASVGVVVDQVFADDVGFASLSISSSNPLCQPLSRPSINSITAIL